MYGRASKLTADCVLSFLLSQYIMLEQIDCGFVIMSGILTASYIIQGACMYDCCVHVQPTSGPFPPEGTELEEGAIPLPGVSWSAMQPQGPGRLLSLPLWMSLQFLGEGWEGERGGREGGEKEGREGGEEGREEKGRGGGGEGGKTLGHWRMSCVSVEMSWE